MHDIKYAPHSFFLPYSLDSNPIPDFFGHGILRTEIKPSDEMQ